MIVHIVLFLLVSVAVNCVGAIPREFNDFISVGTVLFSREDLNKNKWHKPEIALLQARMHFQKLIPPCSHTFLDVNGSNINKMLTYFHNAYQAIRIHAEDSILDNIMTIALSDTIGGYLKSWALPLTKLAFYEGNVSYEDAVKMFNLYEEIKMYLTTDGSGWRSPDKKVFNIADRKSGTLLYAGFGHSTNACDNFSYFERTPQGFMIPLPTINWCDYTMFLPIKNNPVIYLTSPKSQKAVLKYYTSAKRCMEEQNPNATKDFTEKFETWVAEDVVPHLIDSDFCAALGSILGILDSKTVAEHFCPAKEVLQEKEVLQKKKGMIAKLYESIANKRKVCINFCPEHRMWLFGIILLIEIMFCACAITNCFSKTKSEKNKQYKRGNNDFYTIKYSGNSTDFEIIDAKPQSNYFQSNFKVSDQTHTAINSSNKKSRGVVKIINEIHQQPQQDFRRRKKEYHDVSTNKSYEKIASDCKRNNKFLKTPEEQNETHTLFLKTQKNVRKDVSSDATELYKRSDEEHRLVHAVPTTFTVTVLGDKCTANDGNYCDFIDSVPESDEKPFHDYGHVNMAFQPSGKAKIETDTQTQPVPKVCAHQQTASHEVLRSEAVIKTVQMKKDVLIEKKKSEPNLEETYFEATINRPHTEFVTNVVRHSGMGVESESLRRCVESRDFNRTLKNENKKVIKKIKYIQCDQAISSQAMSQAWKTIDYLTNLENSKLFVQPPISPVKTTCGSISKYSESTDLIEKKVVQNSEPRQILSSNKINSFVPLEATKLTRVSSDPICSSQNSSKKIEEWPTLEYPDHVTKVFPNPNIVFTTTERQNYSSSPTKKTRENTMEIPTKLTVPSMTFTRHHELKELLRKQIEDTTIRTQQSCDKGIIEDMNKHDNIEVISPITDPPDSLSSFTNITVHSSSSGYVAEVLDMTEPLYSLQSIPDVPQNVTHFTEMELPQGPQIEYTTGILNEKNINIPATGIKKPITINLLETIPSVSTIRGPSSSTGYVAEALKKTEDEQSNSSQTSNNDDVKTLISDLNNQKKTFSSAKHPKYRSYIPKPVKQPRTITGKPIIKRKKESKNVTR